MTLEEIRALCEAATPGPWKASGGHYVAVDAPLTADCDTVADCFSTHNGRNNGNQEFIAAARMLLPALLIVAEIAMYSVERAAELKQVKISSLNRQRLKRALDRLEYPDGKGTP